MKRTADRAAGWSPAGTDAVTEPVTVWRDAAARARFDDPAFAAEWEALGGRCAWRDASLGDSVGTSFLRAWLAAHDAVPSVVAVARDERRALVAGLVLTGTVDGRQLVLPGNVFRRTDGWVAGPEATIEVLRGLLTRLVVEVGLPPRFVLSRLPPAAAVLWQVLAGESAGPPVVVDPGADAHATDARAAAGAAPSGARDMVIRRDGLTDACLAALPALCDFAGAAVGGAEPFRDDPALRAAIGGWIARDPRVTAGCVTQDGATAAAYLALGAGGAARALLAGWHPAATAAALAALPPPLRAPGAAVRVTVRLRGGTGVVGTGVARVAGALRAQAARVRRVGLARVPGKVLLRVRRRLGLSPMAEMRMYVYPLDAARRLEAPAVMRRDAVDDLLAYAPAADGDASPRGAFLAEAWQRLARGEHVYTRVTDGVLAHYGWVIDRTGPAFAAEVGRYWEAQPGTSNLYDFYTHPRFRGRGLYGQALRQIVGEVARLPRVRHVVIWVLADNAASRGVIEKVGFLHHLSLVGRPRPAPALPASHA